MAENNTTTYKMWGESGEIHSFPVIGIEGEEYIFIPKEKFSVINTQEFGKGLYILKIKK